jgi:hypothetical protein
VTWFGSIDWAVRLSRDPASFSFLSFRVIFVPHERYVIFSFSFISISACVFKHLSIFKIS